ncbi:S66 family peptidase [Halobacillus salinus]|uniref:LD-carboxypeptidase n=1 Tax=Halobacillus salinus TaxID=192814 RepID=A0A4Z0H2T7_9BACI|nr:S66 peptidase family protein [Halobacillus salinus]TGB03721.1 LD-carboxypeptidase [Halobacillus salinus]
MLRLKQGDKIGIFTPSTPATVTAKQRFERAKSFLESKGFVLVEGKLTGKEDAYRSGTPRKRADELNELLQDPDIKMVMSTIGGTNSNSLLPYIDYETFKKNPKIVVGYSDATAILLALYQKTNVTTYYGPALIPSFGEFEPLVNDTYRYFENYFVRDVEVPYGVPMPTYWSDEPVNWLDKTKEKTLYNNEWISRNNGTAEGRLIGGNVNAMYGFIGSDFFPDIEEGDVLLLEDCAKNASVVEKNFAMLNVHGIFEKVSGIILGKHEAYDDLGTGKKPVDLLLEQLDGKDIPILAEFDTCHTHPMHPFAIGKKVRIDTTAKTVQCIEGWL